MADQQMEFNSCCHICLILHMSSCKYQLQYLHYHMFYKVHQPVVVIAFNGFRAAMASTKEHSRVKD